MKNLTIYLGVLANKDDFAQVCKAGQVCGSSTAAPLTTDTRFNFMTFSWSQQIQPRLGITWNPNLLSSDKLYSTYGEYAGMDQKSTARSFAPFRIRQDQAYFCTVTTGCGSVAYGGLMGTQFRGSSGGKFIPTDLKPPYYQEFILGYSGGGHEGRHLRRLLPVPQPEERLRGHGDRREPLRLGHLLRQLPGGELPRRAARSTAASRSTSRSGTRTAGTPTRTSRTASSPATSTRTTDSPSSTPPRSSRTSRAGTRPIRTVTASCGRTARSSSRRWERTTSPSASPWAASSASRAAHRGRPAGRTPSTDYGRYLEPAGSHRLPTWTNFDLLAAYTFKPSDTLGVRLEARVQNLFNTQTVLSVDEIKYFDAYVDGTPPSTPYGPQGTSQPNPAFGNADELGRAEAVRPDGASGLLDSRLLGANPAAFARLERRAPPRRRAAVWRCEFTRPGGNAGPVSMRLSAEPRGALGLFVAGPQGERPWASARARSRSPVSARTTARFRHADAFVPSSRTASSRSGRAPAASPARRARAPAFRAAPREARRSPGRSGVDLVRPGERRDRLVALPRRRERPPDAQPDEGRDRDGLGAAASACRIAPASPCSISQRTRCISSSAAPSQRPVGQSETAARTAAAHGGNDEAAPFARHASGSRATAAPPSGASATRSGRRYRVATKNAATARTYAGTKAAQTRSARRAAPADARSARTKPAPASGTRRPGPDARGASARGSARGTTES